MKKRITISALAVLCLHVFIVSCMQSNSRTGEAKTIISKHTIRFTEPPRRIPSRTSVDAPLLGNGFTGVAISGNPEKQVFHVARNDFWRLKSALDESYPMVLGKVELSIPQLDGASYLMEQQLYEAVSTAHFKKDNISVQYKACVAATEDLLIVEVSNDGQVEIAGTVRIELPGDREIVHKLPFERVFPDKRESNTTQDGIHYISRAFEDSVDIKTKAAMSLKVEKCPDGRFILQPGKSVWFACAFSSNFKSDDCVKTVIEKVAGLSSRTLAKIDKAHRQWWKDYWEKSYVSIPDSVMEKQYYVSLYGMGACSRDLDFPPSLFGSWITQEPPFWNGDYHLNYNHMAPYYGLYSSNRMEQADPYYMPLLAAIPRGRYYSEKIAGIPDGILLPVGIGPLGIETTRRSPFMDQYFQDWIKSKNVEDEGMFWGQKSNAAYAVTNMANQFYRTWDKEFAEKVYPFIKGVADFWENYLVYEDGRYVIYNDAIHEGTVGTKNPILSLGTVRLVMKTAIDMSNFLNKDGDKKEKWEHIKSHLSEFPLQERNGKTVFRYTEAGTDWWDSNTLGIQHIYPGGQIGLESDPKLLEVARNTIEEMQRWIDYNGSNSFFPASVRVGYDSETILKQLHRYSENIYPNGFQRGNPHGIENFSTVPNTINEMLCMGHQDIVRVFPVWPKGMDALFYQIRVEGAFLVSSELVNQEIPYVNIYSEQGRELTLFNPWYPSEVLVKKGKHTMHVKGEYISMETEPGVMYEFSKSDFF